MKASILALIMLCCSVSAGTLQTAAPGKASADAPASLVRELYRVHRQGRGPIFTGKSKVYLQKFFDQKLADLLWKILTAKTDEVGPLDFDPLFNAQDVLLSNFRIGASTGDDQQAVVVVTFRNDTRPETIRFSLRHTKAGWRVANIIYTDGSDLIKILSSPQ
jgi:Protein of unknown function (DUF3828)